MKKIKVNRSYYLVVILAVLFSLASCLKPNPEEGMKEHKVQTMNDLVVDNDFSWKTTKTLDVNIQLPADVNVLPISIASDDGKRVFFTGYPEDKSNYLSTRITVPSYEQQLKLIFAPQANMPDEKVPITGNKFSYNVNNNLKTMMMPCDLRGLVTYSQGGWHAPAHGNNAGTLRDTYFSTVFPGGLVLGDPNHFTMTFTSAQAVASFLPAGGNSRVLTQHFSNPSNASQVGSWAGQIMAAMLNVAFNDAGYLGNNSTNKLKDLVFLSGPFSGMSVSNFLNLANTALGGGGLGGFSIDEIAYAAEQINTNFEQGDLNYFTCTANSGGNGTGPTEVHYSGTLAYEDLWPWKGDYDFNDMVISYNFAIYKNVREQIRHITATFTLYAFGASFYNGFGFSLPHVSPDAILNVSGYHLSGNTVHLNPNGLEANQAHATVIVFDDAFDLMRHPGMGTGVNTDPAAPYVEPDTLVIEMSFMDNGVPAAGGPVTFNQLDIGSFNPFIIVNQERGVEVHLPGYPPTSLADMSLIGTGQDSGDPGTGRYYKTVGNLPWAINIPERFNYPIEKQDITGAYLHFADWAQSDGLLYPDWFLDKAGYRNHSLIYQNSQ